MSSAPQPLRLGRRDDLGGAFDVLEIDADRPLAEEG